MKITVDKKQNLKKVKDLQTGDIFGTKEDETDEEESLYLVIDDEERCIEISTWMLITYKSIGLGIPDTHVPVYESELIIKVS